MAFCLRKMPSVTECFHALRACMYFIDVSDATVNAVKAKTHARLPRRMPPGIRNG